MKYSNFLLLFFFFGLMQGQAQDLMVTEQTITYEDKTRSCIQVTLKPSTKDVKKAYKNWMEDNQDVDVDGLGFLKNKDVLTVEKESVKAISTNQIDLYAQIIEKGDHTEMSVFGSMGYDLHISRKNYPIEFRKMRSMVYAFLTHYLPGYYQEKIEDTKESIEDLQEDTEETQEDIEDNRKEIEELRKENAELLSKVKGYEDQLKKEKSKLNNQKQEKTKVKNAIKHNK